MKTFSNFFLALFCQKRTPEDFTRSFFADFVSWVIFTYKYLSLHVATLRNHIVCVILFGSNKKVFWIITRPVVAMMQNAGAIYWNSAPIKNPRGSMRKNQRSPASPSANMSITSRIKACGPYPARSKFWSVWWNWPIFIHLLPEPFRKAERQSLRSEIFCGNFNHRNVPRRLGYWPSGAFNFTAARSLRLA